MRPGEPSATARRVAAHRLRFERVAVPYGDARGDELLARDVAGGTDVDPEGPMVSYLAARTSFFDRVVVSCLQEGLAQVVVVGAGYDGRALRYSKPGVRWFEVDHIDTQSDKVARLARLGLLAPGVRFVDADLRDGNLAGRLRTAGCDPGARTLFVCEGVAVYLDDAVFEDVVGNLRRAGSDRSRLAVSLSVATSSSESTARRARFEQSVQRVGEPVRSGLTVDSATSLFERTRWRRLEPVARVEAAARRAGLIELEAA